MEENNIWKIVYAAGIFSLLVLFFAYYLISPRDGSYFNDKKTDRIAEFKNTRVAGYKENKKIWEFAAKSGWTSHDQETTFLIDVSKGAIYSDGQLIVKELSAPRVSAQRRSSIVEAGGFAADKPSGKSRLTTWLDLKKVSTRKKADSEWIKLRTDFLKYSPENKHSELSGKVELRRQDSVIFAQKVAIDHEQRIADISDGIKVSRKDGVLFSDTMRYFGQEEKIAAAGRVKLNITHARYKTKLIADQAGFFADMNRDMRFSGSVEVIQGKKVAVAQAGVYSLPQRRLLLTTEVKAVFEKASAVVQTKSVAQLKNQEAKDILREKTFLTADSLVIFTDTGNAQAGGNVHVYQLGREAKADQSVFDEKKETLILTGRVLLKKGKDWVSAQQVIVSIKNKTFEASGEVKAEFKI
ncbi:hypothetical protein HZB07_06255 [Candidatus Saganbacteria bacterium]|nr:hypothetical protein [Candidatus Saganbacteria bacterium]